MQLEKILDQLEKIGTGRARRLEARRAEEPAIHPFVVGVWICSHCWKTCHILAAHLV